MVGFVLFAGGVRVESDNPGYDGPWRKRCPQCKGSGRRWKEVTTEFFEYSPVKKKYHAPFLKQNFSPGDVIRFGTGE